jgi:hypothetical protein
MDVYWNKPDVTSYIHTCVHETQQINLILFDFIWYLHEDDLYQSKHSVYLLNDT